MTIVQERLVEGEEGQTSAAPLAVQPNIPIELTVTDAEYVGRHRDTAPLYMRVVKALGRIGASVLNYIREADAIVEAKHAQRQAEVTHRAAAEDYDWYHENIRP